MLIMSDMDPLSCKQYNSVDTCCIDPIVIDESVFWVSMQHHISFDPLHRNYEIVRNWK